MSEQRPRSDRRSGLRTRPQALAGAGGLAAAAAFGDVEWSGESSENGPEGKPGSGPGEYPIHHDLLDSPALDRVSDANGTCPIPQCSPEGFPTRGVEAAGPCHVGGATVTVLKACFGEEFVVPDPVIVNEDGTRLESYDGPDLTVGGELNRLASNIATVRNFGGAHYRSEAVEGPKLGEAVASGILHDAKNAYTEKEYVGSILTSLDGELKRIRP